MLAPRLSKRIVGASAAGIAAVFAVAPFAHADPAKPQDSVAPPAPGGSTDGTGATGANTTGANQVTPQGTTQPDFGTRKIRVGVQIKDGSWVPPGTTTADTKVKIVETGPNAEEAIAFNGGTSCRTVDGTQDPGSTETFCEFSHNPAQVKAAGGGSLTPADVPPEADYLAAPGDSVTFTQVTVNKGLVIDSTAHSFDPCILSDSPVGQDQYQVCPNGIDDVVFTDPGLPPQAVDNHATVLSGHSVAISVLRNDITHGAPAKVDSATQPSHGKSFIAVGQAVATATSTNAKRATYSITYKSTAPYVGHDKFFYTMSTPNGKSTATVFITVIAPPPTAVNDFATTQVGTPVTIDVLDNDDANGGGKLSVQSVGAPSHGTATISNGAVVYTPDPGFSGKDTFPYTNATRFGTDTAMVTVTIPAALAATGSSTHNLANLGMLLLVTGGAATVVGRRRYRAKHAGFH
jgi:hypothetical protein